MELVILSFSNYVPDKGVFHDWIKNAFLSRSKILRKLWKSCRSIIILPRFMSDPCTIKYIVFTNCFPSLCADLDKMNLEFECCSYSSSYIKNELLRRCYFGILTISSWLSFLRTTLVSPSKHITFYNFL